MSGVGIINYNDGNIFKLSNLQGNWYRSTVVIIGSFNGQPINLTIGVFMISSTFTAKINGTIPSSFKFYTDGLNLFLKTNVGSANFGELIAYSINSVRGYFKAKKSDITMDKLTEYIF